MKTSQRWHRNMSNKVKIQPLTASNFAAFGEVIECDNHDFFHINNAHTERYHAIALTELKSQSNSTAEEQVNIGISIFRNIRATLIPFKIEMLERHPIGSQAFTPMQGQKFLIIVAPQLDQDTPDVQNIHAFISNGQQGVNYRAGTWHHPLLTLEAPSDFVVIDRIGSGHNCDVYSFEESIDVVK